MQGAPKECEHGDLMRNVIGRGLPEEGEEHHRNMSVGSTCAGTI